MNVIFCFRSVEYFYASTLQPAFPEIQAYDHPIKVILKQNICIFLLVDLLYMYDIPQYLRKSPRNCLETGYFFSFLQWSV